MAVTITRTARIDDDGTGTTGTVINNAEKTSLYNEIDTALAKVAQLTGGNTFTGPQTIGGTVTVNNATVAITNATGMASMALRCTNPGASMAALFTVGNDIDPYLFYIQSFSSGWPTDAQQIANGTVLFSNGAGGLTVTCVQSNAPIKLHTRSTERMRIAPTGEVLFFNPAAPLTAHVWLNADQATHTTGLSIYNASTLNGLVFVQFLNSGSGSAGGIVQTGASSVAYNTSSDARLKTDHGRAADLAALRAVVVHDFTWKADGIRDRGVFAQETHDLYPRAVSTGTDELTDSGDLKYPWMTDYSKFVPDLIVGWQQHDADLAEIRALLATLKG